MKTWRPHAEPPLRTKLPNRVSGTDQRTLSEASRSLKQGMGSGPSSGTCRGRGVPTSPNRTCGPSVSRG